MRLSLLSPTTRPSGMYAMCATPTMGRKWCSHVEFNVMLRSTSMWSYPYTLSKVLTSGWFAGLSPPEDFLDVHLGHAMRRACQAVVVQIQAQQVHDVPKFGFDRLDFVFVDMSNAS